MTIRTDDGQARKQCESNKSVGATDDLSHKQGSDLLSPRELEVLRYLAGGYQPRHIALRLGIGLPAVQAHLRRRPRGLDAVPAAIASGWHRSAAGSTHRA